MAEPLKNMYTPVFFEQFANKIKAVYPAFEIAHFIGLIYDEHWHERELKQRFRHITICLGQTLPPSYKEAVEILRLIADDCRGFPYLFFPDFVEVYGMEDFDTSVKHLEIFTKSSSAEFAIRPFIVRYPKQMIAIMLEWTKHPNVHVRRLASEGCRPRLPWGMALVQFKKDPAPILPILTALRVDPEEYVRKSVANNLNDITKDHPQLVLDLAQEWYGSNPGTNWIIKHACRNLLKQGSLEALALFGYEKLSAIEVCDLTISPTEIAMGEDLTFTFTIQNNSTETQKFRLEYGIDFVKANGSRNTKIFKISEKTIGPGELQVTKTHRMKEITTRAHYAGEHRLSIRINGVELAAGLFHLTL